MGTATMIPTWPRIAAFERAPPGVGGAAKWVESSGGDARGRIAWSQPALAAEIPGHRHGRGDHDRHAAEEDVDVVERQCGEVHAEEPGEQRQHEEDGGDAR